MFLITDLTLPPPSNYAYSDRQDCYLYASEPIHHCCMECLPSYYKLQQRKLAMQITVQLGTGAIYLRCPNLTACTGEMR